MNNLNVILVTASVALATELLPERYLKPQDFNHHPFTDVGIPAALKKGAVSPYAILSKKKPREGREFPIQNVIYYPTPHPSVISRKHLETNEISKYDDPYVNVPKNYAFSYTVKDQHSGDDFSHSQAHNGKATRGQYRVKLPDGRTQIVSYTADHKGYRADVQYEDEIISKPIAKPLFTPSSQPTKNVAEIPAKLPEVLPSTYQKLHSGYSAKHIPPVDIQPSAEAVYSVAQNYKPDESYQTATATLQYVPDTSRIKILIKSTAAPQYYQPQYSVSTTSNPYAQQQYDSSAGSPKYIAQHYVSSTPLYPVAHASTTATPLTYQQDQYQNYQHVSSTVAPQQAVIVTPRPVYSQAIAKNEQQQSGVLYRLL